MEIPVINRISEFETGLTSLQNPTFLSQIFALSGIEKIHQAYSFMKWGALILAFVASFTTIINRIQILIFRFRNHSLISSPSFISNQDDFDCESETDTSSSLSEDEEEQEEESHRPSSTRSWVSIDDQQDFNVRGSGNCYNDEQWQNGKFSLRRLRSSSSIGDFFSLSELANGKNVVKLWDNLGLGLGLNLYNSSSDSTNAISFCDINKEQNICSGFGSKCNIAAVSTSPGVVVSTETNPSGNSFSLWDTRIGFRMPEVFAEWRPTLGKIVGVSGGGGGGVEKVYFRGDVTDELMVGDIRKVSSPLANVTESDVDTWWDADAVIVDDE